MNVNVQVLMEESSALGAFLQKLQEIRFYGKIEVNYENGRIQLIRTTEHIKPESLLKVIQTH